MEEAVEEPPRTHGAIHSSPGYRRARVVPHRDDLQLAAELLNSGEKVAMLVGAGALAATDAVIKVAEMLGAVKSPGRPAKGLTARCRQAKRIG